MSWRATLWLLEHLPQASLSRLLGRMADTPIPPAMRQPVIGTLARTLGIDTSEAEHAVAAYRSINDFFVRRLREGVRTWPDDDSTIASPVDGIIGEYGRIENGRLLQAKGKFYTAGALLGDEADAEQFDRGTFVTIYLSPRHYHRIHAPCSGRIVLARHIPGALMPVNEPAVTHVPDLFPRNERVLCAIDGPLGGIAVVAVGAYNVGRISTSFDDDWVGPGRSVANRRDARAETRHYEPPIRIRQGDEIMAFHLGSTVVLLVEPGLTLSAPPVGSDVRLGAVLMRALPDAA